MTDLLILADRVEGLSSRINGVLENHPSMTPEGQATSIAMLVTLHLPLLRDVSESLRTIAANQEPSA